MEFLAHEAAVHVADIDDIDVLGLDPGMGDGLAGRLHDQRFAGLAVELAELAVGPSDDAGGHGSLLCCWPATLNGAPPRVEGRGYVHIHLYRLSPLARA